MMRQNGHATPASIVEIERHADRLLFALETLVMARIADSTAAERYGARLRFALARVEELRQCARAAGGVFELARMEVAASILEANVRRAATFVDEASARIAPPSRRTDRSADLALQDDDAPPLEFRAA